jgi:hypothetical protein
MNHDDPQPHQAPPPATRRRGALNRPRLASASPTPLGLDANPTPPASENRRSRPTPLRQQLCATATADGREDNMAAQPASARRFAAGEYEVFAMA